MSSVLSELKKQGTAKLSGGATLTKEGKAANYEGVQQIRAKVALTDEAIESAATNPPIIVLMESLSGLIYTQFLEGLAWLTPREHEVFGEMGAGTKNRQIAEKLGISTKTLDIHRANIAKKLGLRNQNAFGRAYWFFRVCNEFAPQLLEAARREVRPEDM